jgi:oxidase EvaA
MHIARTAADLARSLDQSRAGFEVKRVPAAAAADQWSVIDGALQHSSRGFFSVSGVRRRRSGKTDMLLYQPQGAVTGLLSARIDGEACYLLQARAEPGCLGEAQFGPTVQSTPANFMRLHGGASTAYIESFIAHDPNLSLLDDTTQLDLGLRYLFKTKRSILAETSAPAPPLPGFIWASRGAISEAVRESAFFNIDLRSILSIAAWSGNDTDGALAPRNGSVRRGLAAPIRPDVVARLVAALADGEREDTEFVALDGVENWRSTEWGWSEREPRQGFAIEFFETNARFREKASWVQPLVNSPTEGEVVLACRKREGQLEFLVRAVAEIGLATGAALAPTYVRYPGAAGAAPSWLQGSDWSATTESDEGGRFYRDASRYRIVRVEDAPDVSDGAWLRLPELKLFLRMSNMCTIQLRGVVSQLLGVD